MRICFIGNSHLGHAGRAVRSLLRERPHEADLFIERSYGTAPLTLRRVELVRHVLVVEVGEQFRAAERLVEVLALGGR